MATRGLNGKISRFEKFKIELQHTLEPYTEAISFEEAIVAKCEWQPEP